MIIVKIPENPKNTTQTYNVFENELEEEFQLWQCK